VDEQNSKIINTGLPGFLLLDAVMEVEDKSILGVRRFSHAPPWLGVEALIQIGAFHVRFLSCFERHVFLLKINRCLMPRQPALEGEYRLEGRLLSRSSNAFSCELTAIKEGLLELSGNFLYAAVDYDERFQEERLRDRYLKAFECLRNVTGKNFCKEGRKDSSEPLP
jgi:hypothetical protein